MSAFTDAQRQAIVADGNVLVSAGAGTGKTRTVVERCLRILAEGGSLDRLLMVTFTEAAAAEMRARIRKTLQEQVTDLVADPSAAGEAGGALTRDALQEQLALLDMAHISTLHSFCLQLIRDHFHELDIDPQVNVLDETQTAPLMRETLDGLLERCYASRADYAPEIQQMVRRAGGSDYALRMLVLRLHRYTQSLPPSDRWYERELARLDAGEPAHWREWLAQGVLEWRDEWLPELEVLAESPNVRNCHAALLPLGVGAGLPAIAEALRCVSAAHEDKWPRSHPKKDFRDPLKVFFEEADFLLSLLEGSGNTDPLTEDWQWLQGPTRALLRLARDFTAGFTRAKRALAGVDFADLEQLALRLLVDGEGEPTAAARAWQERFSHVFVDECQDINAAQDAIIRAVSRPSGNRFLVGDVKQSIYRFRLADPGIFRRCEERWRNGEGGSRISLADNFRSREPVLNFINAFFAGLMRPSIGGIEYGADAELRFGAAQARHALSAAGAGGPRVELHVVHVVEDSNGENGNGSDNGDGVGSSDESAPGTPVEDVLALEKEARLVAQRLRALHDGGHEIWDVDRNGMRRAEWKDMVVLLRSPAARVETFAKEFRRAGVPLSAARAGFYSALEVQDLLNLLRLLDNPLQDIPFAAVLRSPLVAMSVEELAALRIAGGEGDKRITFVSAANHFHYKQPATSLPAAESARAKLARFRASLERWRALVRQSSVSHCLEVVLAETHYEALLLAQGQGRERVANLSRLLDLARQYDPFQRQGLYRFLRFVSEQQEAELDQEFATAGTTDAVRLMSIHRSKGLEFPVVAVACLGAQFNTQDQRGDVLLSREFGLCAKIVPPEIEQRYPSLPWWLARRHEHRELLGEEMRLLYVAMTRARDTLLLTAFEKGKAAGSRWHENRPGLGDRAILKAPSYFGWLRRWLGTSTSDANWSEPRAGQSDWLRWQLYPEDDAIFRAGGAAARQEPKNGTTEFNLAAVQERITWRYPSMAATQEPAKTNVSALRRRATEQDDEARQWSGPIQRAKPAGRLSAAQIGSAHHLFLQHVALGRTGSMVELRNEAQRLVEAGHLTAPEVEALDLAALLRFWVSPHGRRVVASEALVHRELPFTARFQMKDLQALGLGDSTIVDDFVVVQGVVDLALLKPDGIEIIDFKTDRAFDEDLALRADSYNAQVRLYAAALGAIYGKPVTSAALHFLASGETRCVRLQ